MVGWALGGPPGGRAGASGVPVVGRRLIEDERKEPRSVHSLQSDKPVDLFVWQGGTACWPSW